MTTTDPERDENDLLLPWHATGRLDRAEAARLDAALARDPELARRLDLVRTERAETTALNESLGVPSRKGRDDLFARIDADLAGRSRQSGGWLQRLGSMLAGLSPPVLAGSALAACVLILLQAGLLTGMSFGGPTASYETASHGGSGPVAGGTFILVAFAPTATVAQVTEAFGEARLSIVDGPRAGGVYRVRLAEGPGSVAAALDRLRARPGLVALAVPEAAPAR